MSMLEKPTPLEPTLPTMYDLPSDYPEDPGLPDVFHDYQPQLLRETFRPPEYPPDQVFTASDLNLYYDVEHTRWYKRPDWFAVLGTARLYENRDLRLSYVTWQEPVKPYLVIELLSEGNDAEDLGLTRRIAGGPPTKWQVYEDYLRVPYYVVFSRFNDTMRVFKLSQDGYREIKPFAGRLWLPEAKLGLGCWSGNYEGYDRLWLRFYDVDDQWLPTHAEWERIRAEQEHERAEQEHERAEQAEQRAEQLAARLRALGVDPDEL